MFDFSFSELLVVGVVALIVIGPERLPRVARTIGHLLGRLQRYVADVKSDINREMELEELRRLRTEMDEAARSVEATARSIETSARRHVGEIQDAVDATKREATRVGSSTANVQARADAASADTLDAATRAAIEEAHEGAHQELDLNRIREAAPADHPPSAAARPDSKTSRSENISGKAQPPVESPASDPLTRAEFTVSSPDVGVAESEKVAQQRTGGSQEVSVQNEPRHHAQSDQTAAASAAPRTSSQERSSAPVSSAATSQ